ncbi:hypothetical protein BH23GEM3_BH23GEM3_10020 [soil metagenome]
MRIGVDACCWANGRGYGRFTRELLHHMVAAAPEHEFVCVLDAAAAECFDISAPNIRAVPVELSAQPTTAASADGYRSPADLLRLTGCVSKLSLDVFFSPSVYTYSPLPPRLRAVVAIHDAIADGYPELTLPSRRARFFWRAKVWLALRQSRLVLTVSDFSARELTEVLGVAPERIRVSVEAPAARYRPSDSLAEIQAAAGRFGLSRDSRWFIYVGGFNPHKTVDAIVGAHAKLGAESADPPHLLLVGRTDGDVFLGNIEQIRSAIRAAGTESLVHWTGFVVLWRHGREPCTGRECLRCVLRTGRPPQLWRYTGLLERQSASIHAFIALSEFSRSKHREFGFRREMRVIPPFLPASDASAPDPAPPHPRPYFLFVGRLERIKGLDDVIPVFHGRTGADLLIVGEGTHAAELRKLAAGDPRIHFLGPLPADALSRYYQHAIAVLAPSLGYETFGMVLIEAFRAATPVIARRIGPFPEIVERAGGGELFSSPAELRAALDRFETDTGFRRRLGDAAAAAFTRHWPEAAVLPRYLQLVEQTGQCAGLPLGTRSVREATTV